MVYLRYGGVFDLSWAPAPDLTAPLRSAVARHDAIPSVGDFPQCTVSNVIISTSNLVHVRSL